MSATRKFCVLGNGCPENRIDAASMQQLLGNNGWIATPSHRDADVILFNACAATLFSQESSIGIINRIQDKKKPAAQLVVCGCLPRINNARLQQIYRGPTFGPDEIEPLCRFLETTPHPVNRPANHLIPIVFRWNPPPLMNIASLVSVPKLLTRLYHLVHRQGVNNIGPDDFCIKVSTGCLHACSYCAIRLSRGRVKSRPIERITDEFEEGYARGYREFTLIATDLGAYGRDRGTNLAALLRELVKRPGDYAIKLQYIQPRFLIDMMPGLQSVFQSGKISRLCTAVESGSDRILRLMNRGYRIGEFKEAVSVLNNQFPSIRVCTQVMVGFPSETEVDFQDTVSLLDEGHFDSVEAYVYQPRPHTVAEGMKDHIPERVAHLRLLRVFARSVVRKRMVFVW